jgi:UDP-apiose/xylose synthase
MKILLLGGSGFIGSHMVDTLLTDTLHEIWVYDLYEEKLKHSLSHPRLNMILGDIRDERARVEELIRTSDLVIDLIAYANPSLYIEIPLEVFQLNFTENLAIVEFCVKHRKRLIQFSTCEVYGKTAVSLLNSKLPDPENPSYATFHEDTTPMILGPINKHRWIYANAKQLLERILHAYGLEDKLNYTIIRPFNFIGPKIDYLPSEKDGIPRVFSNFLQALMDGSPMHLVEGGHHRRTYTFIQDAVDCIVRIIENPNNVCEKQIFNIGSPTNEVSVRELAMKMKDQYIRKWWDGASQLPEIVEVSANDFYGEGYDDSDRRIPDITKATTLLGWRPTYNVDDTIEQSMAYWFEPKTKNPKGSLKLEVLGNKVAP